jgi:hypothetical protein
VRETSRDRIDGEHDGDELRRRRSASAGVAEPHQHRVPVAGGVAAVLRRGARLRAHPAPGLLQLRRRMVRSNYF